MSEHHIETALKQFLSAMEMHGITIEDEVEPDGELHRVHIIDDKPGTKNGWYILNMENVPWGMFGCWKRGVQKSWSNRRSETMTDAELTEHKARQAIAKEKLEADLARRRAECAALAKRLWKNAKPAVSTHPYLANKKVRPLGLRQHENTLLVPLRDSSNSLVGLQFIRTDGSKRFLTGTPKKGSYFSLHFKPTPPVRILICEGYATGASLHEATGDAVIVAFDAGNLLPVAESIRSRFPDMEIILCADNDHLAAENRGLLDATAAAHAVNGKLALPSFPDSQSGTDFNDLHQLNGLDAVRLVIAAAIEQTAATSIQAPKVTRQSSSYGGFTVSHRGVTYDEGDDGPLWLCSRLDIIAKTRDSSSSEWGRLLQWSDDDQVTHSWAMPMDMLQSDGNDFRRELSRQGLAIATGSKARTLLSTYINTWRVDARARCVDRLGWHGNVYITPTECIGQQSEVVVFQNAHAISPALTQKGTLEDWRNTVSALSTGNSRLIFALSVSFAGPLAAIAGEDSGGFHLRGASSSGKSTALKVAASVWGLPEKYRRLWRATTNGLEGLASLHNDGTLILDELSQMPAHEVGDAAYMLANGQGKARASRTGATRPAAQWRLIFLSAGEVSLSSMIASTGKKANAGQEIRLADIPADAGAGMGAFEALNGHNSPNALADGLSVASSQFHGTVGMAWLNIVVTHRAKIAENLQLSIKQFVSRVVPNGSSGQVMRVAKRFGLVAQAGELATAMQITGWRQGDASRAAEVCFAAWLRGFGGMVNREDQQIGSQVRAFFELHGASRFEAVNNTGMSRVNNRAGFIREVDGKHEYLVLPEVFKNEICRGLSPRAVEAFLCDRKWIEPAKDRIQQKPRIPAAGGNPRVYVFTPQMWEDTADEEAELPTSV